VCSVCVLYVVSAAVEFVCVCACASLWASLKRNVTNLIFQPFAMENLEAFSSSSSDFISALGHKNSSVSGEERETSFLFQRLSVALQRFSAVLLHDTFVSQDDPDQQPYQHCFYCF